MTARILVVDDEPDLEALILQKFRRQLRDGTVRFLFARDGIDALAALKANGDIDLVVTDINMPRMDGLTLLQEMKKDERFAQLPVILVTSMNRTEDQERGLALGADAYLVKQRFDHQTLLETIKQLL